jgi:hypothetical protein
MTLPSKTANSATFREALTDCLAAMDQFCRPDNLPRTVVDDGDPAGFRPRIEFDP